ncbi:MAG: S-adenosylmethionine decarboxylase [Cytophagaceae bacterium]|nr:S-adenosylmethionine decarboxylase [Cytophagaceae bacterium]
MSYSPGLHVLGSIHSEQQELLSVYEGLQTFIDERLSYYELHKLGEYYHSFDKAGFTGVVCLTESHIAFHTWPEHNYLTLDIYLSNYQKVNDEKSRALFEDCCAYFKATAVERTEVKR